MKPYSQLLPYPYAGSWLQSLIWIPLVREGLFIHFSKWPYSSLWVYSCNCMVTHLSSFYPHYCLPWKHASQVSWTVSWANLQFNNPSDDTLEQNVMAILAELEAKFNWFEFRKTYSFNSSNHSYSSVWRWLHNSEDPNYQTQWSSAWDNSPVQRMSHTGMTNHPPLSIQVPEDLL